MQTTATTECELKPNLMWTEAPTEGITLFLYSFSLCVHKQTPQYCSGRKGIHICSKQKIQNAWKGSIYKNYPSVLQETYKLKSLSLHSTLKTKQKIKLNWNNYLICNCKLSNSAGVCTLFSNKNLPSYSLRSQGDNDSDLEPVISLSKGLCNPE